MEKLMVTCVYPIVTHFPSLVMVNGWWLSRKVAAMGVIVVIFFF